MYRRSFRWQASLTIAALLFSGAAAYAAVKDAESLPLQSSRSATLRTTVPGWGMRLAATVGGANAPADQLLYGVVGDVVEDLNGRFYVLNFGDKRLLAFDRGGRHLWTSGREGRGPGEFRAPAAVAVVQREVYVLDAPSYSLTQLHPHTGAAVRSIPLGRQHGFPMDAQSGDQRTLVVNFERASPGRGGARPHLARVTLPGGQVTPLVTLDSLVQIAAAAPQGSRSATLLIEPPFAPRPVWAAGPEGSVLFGTGARYEVFRSTGRGRQLAFRVRKEAERVTAADRTAFFDSRPDLQNARPPILFPTHKPLYMALRSDPLGFIWIRIPSRQGGEVWEVRDTAGRKRGEVQLAQGARVAGISRHSVYVVQKDENDVEAVRRFARSVASR